MSATIATLKQIYTTSRPDIELQPFVDMGNLIVAEDLADTNLTLARKDLIASYLAAHFLAITDSQTQEGGGGGASLKSQKLGEASETYAVPTNEYGFLTSMYGQQALALDTSGKLAASQANKGIKAQFEVVGDMHLERRPSWYIWGP